MKKKIVLPVVVLFLMLSFICVQILQANRCSSDVSPLGAEQATVLENLHAYSFLNLNSNKIVGSAALDPFFEKLHGLEQQHDRIVNIVHIGDSHIQADMMTEEIRILLQRSFGNAGRGLVFPHRIARSNEPKNIQSTVTGAWQQVSVIMKNRDSEPGIGSRTVFTSDGSAEFSILTENNGDLDYSFKKISLLASTGDNCFDYVVSNDWGEEIPSAQSTDGCFNFEHNSNFLSVRMFPLSETQNEFRLNGLVFQNDAPGGILYHSLGTNGAHFADYNGSPEFFAQLPLLQSDLIIVSLGANEGAARDISMETVYAEACRMIRNIRAVNPETPILLTVPVHDYYRKKYLNPRIAIVEKALRKAAADKNCALIDLYAAGGGNGSCEYWKAQGLLRPDGVHFTEEGYRLQGDLIFNAIVNSYTKYVASH